MGRLDLERRNQEFGYRFELICAVRRTLRRRIRCGLKLQGTQHVGTAPQAVRYLT
jgi:hypothetical protein